jgi:probable phosphoglycerate mutase
MNSSIPTVLYAVRHGETEWNFREKQQGHLDSPLTNLGVRQAEAMAIGLSKKNIEVLYSSDLERALQTAGIIAQKLSLSIQTDARLRERHLGLMQGLTGKEFNRKYPEEAKKYNSGNPDYALPGGESAPQQYDRCIECAEDLASRNSGQRILVVAHGGVLQSFLYKTLNLPLTEPRRFSLFNAGINCFTVFNGQWRLDTWGEIAHLQDMTTLDDS